MSKKKEIKSTSLNILEKRLKEKGIKIVKKGETSFMNHLNDIIKRT